MGGSINVLDVAIERPVKADLVYRMRLHKLTLMNVWFGFTW